MKLVGDQVQIFLMSSTKPPRHFWLKERKSQVQHILDVQFGPQNCPNLQQSPRLHTESNWDVLALCGKVIKYIFKWIPPHPHIFFEPAAVIVLLWRPFLATGVVTPIFRQWASTNLWRPPWLHTESDWDVQVLGRNIMKSTFQYIQPHPHIISESAAIIVLLQIPFLSTGAATPIFGQRAVYHVSSIRDTSCGWRTTQAPLWSSSHLLICS